MKMMGIVLSCLGILVVGNAWGSDLTLKELQAKLGRSAPWQASESWVTQLSSGERKSLLGAQLSKDHGSFFISRVTTRAGTLPKQLDWGNYRGQSFNSPVLNQGRCGSCVAFAAIGTLETQANITRNTPNSPWAFSPQYLFACGGGTCATGWQPYQAAEFLQTTGVPDEACMPYTSGAKGVDGTCFSACGNLSSRTLKITGYSTPTMFFPSTDAVKKALQKGPLITTLSVYTDFLFYRSGVYKHTTGKLEGGHAVSIVGYSDPDQAWIVRNSWGPDWGDKGFVKVAWSDDSGVGNQTWLLEVAQANGYVTLGSIRDHAVLKGTVTLDIESTYPGTDSLEWNLTRDGKVVAWGRRGMALVSTQYADGVYTLQAVAHHGSATDVSEPRIVYVLNGKLTGSLSFTNVTAGQSITAQSFVMEMRTQSAPVPFSQLTFHAKSVATGEEVTKISTVNVASEMAMSWRRILPAGQYDLTLEGSAGDASVFSAPIRVSVTD